MGLFDMMPRPKAPPPQHLLTAARRAQLQTRLRIAAEQVARDAAAQAVHAWAVTAFRRVYEMGRLARMAADEAETFWYRHEQHSSDDDDDDDNIDQD